MPDLHGGRRLLAKLEELLVAFFDLFVERLILDLKLFEIDQVELVRELLLAAQVALKLSQLVPEVDILQPHLLQLRLLLPRLLL